LQVVLDGELASAGNFQVKFSAEEDKVMKAIERLFLEKKFSSASFEELVKKFKIHPSRLNTMLGLLLQKQKIVQSKDGFILHSQWLEELKSQVAQMKRKGKTELTVGEFKKMTGLTRKYAIPLLEFLDELGLTRRMGSKRAIL
jgi:selenocysteine-specific elongation factor